MATIANLDVSISARTEALRKGLQKARKRVGAFARNVAGVSTRVASWGAGMAAVAAGGLTALIKKTADAGDRIDKMSKRTGLAEEFLSKLDHAAGLSGTSLETMENAIRKMAQAAADSNAGLKTYQREFDRLGVSVTDSSGNIKDVETLFLESADALSRLENNTLKVSVASKLFGRAGTQLLPMLTQGRQGLKAMMDEAERLGVVWTSKTAGAAALLKDNMSRLSLQIKSTAVEFANALIPRISEIAEGLSAWLNKNKSLISSKLISWANSLGDAISAVYNQVIEWANNRTFELWIARAKAGFLGLKLVGVSIWEGIKGAGNLALAGISKGLDLLVRGFKYSLGQIQYFVAGWAQSLGEHFAGVAGLDKTGRRLMEFAGRTRAQGMGAIEESRRPTAYGKMASIAFSDAGKNAERITKAGKEYMKAAEDVAYLQEKVAQSSTKNIKPIVAAASKIESVAKGTGISGVTTSATSVAAAPKFEEHKIGFGSQINAALMSVAGLSSGTRKQKVEDPQLKETNTILKQIAEQGGGQVAIAG